MTATMLLNLAHISMQFSDSTKQKQHDALEIYKHGYHGITGTEAGEENTKRVLRVAAHNAGYTFFEYKSNWVSIKKSLILPGTLTKFGKTFVDNDTFDARGHDLNVAGCTMKTNGLGVWSLLASHYATRGRPNDPNPGQRVNVDANRKLARGIGRLADKLGAGKALVFYGGDQNIIDRHTDTFFGEDLTTAWDELKKYQNTGHGNIDVIASYDRDSRVKAKYIRALNDKQRFMHTDHFPVEAGFTVKLLKS